MRDACFRAVGEKRAREAEEEREVRAKAEVKAAVEAVIQGNGAAIVQTWHKELRPIEYIRTVMSLAHTVLEKQGKTPVPEVDIPLHTTSPMPEVATLKQLLALRDDESAYKFGLEIEGCYCHDEYDGNALPSFDVEDDHFQTFKVDVDSTIECGMDKCKDGKPRFEIELATDGTFQISDLDTDPRYKEDMQEVVRLLKPCANDSCGTHVHMSRQTEDVRGMADALQRAWLVHQDYMVERYYGPVRAASMYCQENKCVLGPRSYKKNLMLNMCPCVDWSTREFHNGELHVEFRGLGERLEWWRETNLDSFKTYLRDLMTIWSHARLLHALAKSAST
jgi:hypothetical protein